MRILITGAAGFIGFHLAKARLEIGDEIIVVDNMNDYYDVQLKRDRLALLKQTGKLAFYQVDIVDATSLKSIFAAHRPDCVVHLAAQAGVRYSLTHPECYIQSNLVGFGNILEACRQHPVSHLVYASTSSVYGANTVQPFEESHHTDHPLTLYAASKKANELMAHAYSNLFQIPTTGLRFFTVYGPWGRPDMAFFSFTRDIMAGKPIQVFNYGDLQRDFTYIDDIVQGISLAMDDPPKANPSWQNSHPDPGSSFAPYRLFNIGCGAPVNLLDYIQAIEQALGKSAILERVSLPPSEPLSTFASTQRLHTAYGYTPMIDYREGIARFVSWYINYFKTPI